MFRKRCVFLGLRNGTNASILTFETKLESMGWKSCSTAGSAALGDAPPSKWHKHLLQPASRIPRKVRENHVGSGALDAREDLQGNPAFVDPSLLCRGFHHRKLAAHVVGR